MNSVVGFLVNTRWVTPFGNLRVKWPCAPNRSLSQLIASFIADGCQGIPHVPLSASNIVSLTVLENHLAMTLSLHPTQGIGNESYGLVPGSFACAKLHVLRGVSVSFLIAL